jgi:hypothetical protein
MSHEVQQTLLLHAAQRPHPLVVEAPPGDAPALPQVHTLFVLSVEVMKLVTHNLGCNLHQAATWINDWNLAQHVLLMDCISGQNTIIVFRVEDDFDLDKHLDANKVLARDRRTMREAQLTLNKRF